VLENSSLDLSCAYNNGACLKLEGRVNRAIRQTSLKPSLLRYGISFLCVWSLHGCRCMFHKSFFLWCGFRLFKTKLSFSKPLVISYTFKVTSDPSLTSYGCRYFLQLHTSGSPSRVFLDPFSTTEGQGEEVTSGGLPLSLPVPNLPGCVLASLSPAEASRLHVRFTGDAQDDLKEWRTRSV